MRLRHNKAKRELGWTLRCPTFEDGLPAVPPELGLATLTSDMPDTTRR